MKTDDLKSLFEAPDYRSFMKIWIRLKSEHKKFGYSDIARRGGFSSRSFPRDVLTGSKRLTLNSVEKMIRGLQLPPNLAGYFKSLVELEHEDCRPQAWSAEAVRKKLAKQKERLSSKGRFQVEGADAVFSISNVPEVYAALGSVEHGSHLNEITARTGLPERLILDALDKMIELKMVNKKRFRFYPTKEHISLEGLKKSDVFKHHFRKCCERASEAAKQKFDSDEHLFLSSAFSINKHDLPKLKEELRNLLLTYVDSTEKENGNAVINLVAGLF